MPISKKEKNKRFGRFPELAQELMYKPKEQELFDVTKGKLAKPGFGGKVGRLGRKTFIDPLRQAGRVTKKAIEGKPYSMKDVTSAAMLGMAPGVKPGLASGIKIPRLKTTQEAMTFGSKATTTQLARMKKAESAFSRKFERNLKTKKLDTAFRDATAKQLYTEALGTAKKEPTLTKFLRRFKSGSPKEYKNILKTLKDGGYI